MPIPDYQSIMLPLLSYTSDVQEHSLREAIENLADYFELTEPERTELLPSGQQFTFTNRVGWAVTYMKKAGLLEATRRSHFKITERGLKVFHQKPTAFNVKFLKQFPEFIEFQSKRTEPEKVVITPVIDSEKTPEEIIEAAYQGIRNDLADELIQQIMDC